MKRKVIWTKTALYDLENIISYIYQSRPVTAKKWLGKIRKKALSLTHSASRGRVVPELEHIPDLSFRELIIKPWRLIYRVATHVEVLAVLDSRRDLDEILFERLLRKSP